MRLLRSEGEADGEGGAFVPVVRLAALARDWYGDRLDPDWRPRDRAASQAILARHGLTGTFWALA
jgi:hypothetical protein